LKVTNVKNPDLAESTKLDEYLTKVIDYAYKNKFLICNPAISRNPVSSSLLYKVVTHQKPAKAVGRPGKILIKLVQYSLKSFVYFLFFLLHRIAFKQSRLRFDNMIIDRNKDLIVISTFIMIDKIYPKGRFDDPYFGSLYEIMKKRNRQSVILCFLFGDKPWNLTRRIETYNILAKDDRKFITEFELMGLREWFDLIKFIVFYPIAALKLTCKEFGNYDELLREEVIETLDKVQFMNYVKYLVGRRLHRLNDRKLKVISWYENQVIDKLLNKGIRESGSDSKIYGCQFFIKFPLFTSFYPLTAELAHDVLPDEILVSGKYYLDENPNLIINRGLSPRYNYLFHVDLNEQCILDRKDVLVLLTYYKDESIKIIKLVESLNRNKLSQRIKVKLHPNHLLLRPFKYPDFWQYTEEDMNTLLLGSSIVIAGSTSAAIEAAVMGSSVIIVGNEEGLTYNPMPEYGRGQIWDIVFNSDCLAQAIDRLNLFRQKHPDKIISMANCLKNMFFTRTTENKYVELFEL
jgi:hypothetical protein